MSQPINPYAAPQLGESHPQSSPFAPRSSGEPYRSARGKANVVLFLTGAAIVLQVLLAGSFFMQISMLSEALTGGGVEMAVAQDNDLRQMRLSVLLIIFAIAAFIMLLVWVYAAHRNLPALQSHDGEFTPGWAVGWFFIPFMNLFKPYQAMRHLWNESDPRRWRRPVRESCRRSVALWSAGGGGCESSA